MDDDLERILQQFDGGCSWQDDPVTCYRIFKEALDRFTKKVKKGDIIVSVLHYTIRLEVQHRGSPNAHILFWVDERDIDRAQSSFFSIFFISFS